MAFNVLGTALVPCSYDPLTGWLRDGCCQQSDTDGGDHLLCARVSDAFLEYSARRGNDLRTARPEQRFRGLRPGDRWCLCVQRWREAHAAGAAPPVVLEATHEAVLEWVPLATLREWAWTPA